VRADGDVGGEGRHCGLDSVLDESGIEGEEKKDEREGWVGRRVTTKNGPLCQWGELVGTTLSSPRAP
jgi:hypothetical protein